MQTQLSVSMMVLSFNLHHTLRLPSLSNMRSSYAAWFYAFLALFCFPERLSGHLSPRIGFQSHEGGSAGKIWNDTGACLLIHAFGRCLWEEAQHNCNIFSNQKQFEKNEVTSLMLKRGCLSDVLSCFFEQYVNFKDMVLKWKELKRLMKKILSVKAQPSHFMAKVKLCSRHCHCVETC